MEKIILSGGQSVAVSLAGGKIISDDSVVCKSCKTVNQKGKKFCTNCGEKFLCSMRVAVLI